MVSIEYTAGFFDGEGCINCSTNKGGSPFIRILVVNTNIEVLQSFQQRWGGDINKNYRAKAHWKQAYTWRLSHSACANFLKEIQPFLIVKSSQCKSALDFFEIRPNKGHKWSDDKLTLANKFISEIKQANKKGVELH